MFFYYYFDLVHDVVPICLQQPLAQLFDATWTDGMGNCSVYHS